jgi:predicted nucleotidyltransferase
MAEERISEIISFLLNCLKNDSVNVDRIILFGSNLNDTAKEESDLDIGIISGDFNNKDIFERSKLVFNAERITIKQFMVPLDIVMLTPKELSSEASLIASYLNNGKVIFSV